jgi:hypothetical protein
LRSPSELSSNDRSSGIAGSALGPSQVNMTAAEKHRSADLFCARAKTIFPTDDE